MHAVMVAIRNFRYGMEKGWHSKREMDFRGETDVTREFNVAMSDEFDGNYSRSSVLPSC